MLKTVNIIGGGPAGLMAASILSQNSYQVTIFDRKPSLGRKFLLAGRGGLNITHSEKKEAFFEKYGKNSQIFKPIITEFSPQDLRNWCEKLGEKLPFYQLDVVAKQGLDSNVISEEEANILIVAEQ